MPNVNGLVCRECGRSPVSEKPANLCEFCFGPLDVDYNYARIKKNITKKKIKKGPANIWRYLEFLPVETDRKSDLSPGFTPLLKAERLGAALGLKNIYIKNETVNPTFSCKDRMVSVAVTRGLELNINTFACASAGNLAHSLAAHAARAGVKCFIFAPSGTDPSRLAQAAVHAPTILEVNSTPAELNRLCMELMTRAPWGFVNVNLRPYYSEGAKTIAFEIVEQLDWIPPDHIIVPIASGTTLTKMYKGLSEFEETELIKKADSRLHGAQAAGCSPVATAFTTGSNLIKPVVPDTLAKSLSVGNPSDGIYALNAVRKTGGTITSVTDEEILEGIDLLAKKEGVLAEPAGGAAVAVAVKLAKEKIIKSQEVVVLVITGLGLKTPECYLSKISSPAVIKPDFNALDDVIKILNK